MTLIEIQARVKGQIREESADVREVIEDRRILLRLVERLVGRALFTEWVLDGWGRSFCLSCSKACPDHGAGCEHDSILNEVGLYGQNERNLARELLRVRKDRA
jgi:hypothetical protein